MGGSLFARLAFIIFGQRADGAGDANTVAGNGGHGRGQVPPYVRYSTYWEHERRRDVRTAKRRAAAEKRAAAEQHARETKDSAKQDWNDRRGPPIIGG